jgi:hypothetical protein
MAAASPSPSVQSSRWSGGGGWSGHRGHGHGGHWIGPAAGFAAGAAIGSAVASPGYYGYYDNYAYDPYYDDSGDSYVPAYGSYSGPSAAGGEDVAYCMARYKSYDPGSGTFLGYDGERHPCP